MPDFSVFHFYQLLNSKENVFIGLKQEIIATAVC